MLNTINSLNCSLLVCSTVICISHPTLVLSCYLSLFPYLFLSIFPSLSLIGSLHFSTMTLYEQTYDMQNALIFAYNNRPWLIGALYVNLASKKVSSLVYIIFPEIFHPEDHLFVLAFKAIADSWGRHKLSSVVSVSSSSTEIFTQWNRQFDLTEISSTLFTLRANPNIHNRIIN